jgi:dolichol-phosphate mannosyltransferase
LVLPIFNEDLNLARLLDRIDASLRGERPYRIVAVDDGSTDRTSQVLEAYGSRVPLHIVRHAVNRGLGAAVRTGLMQALQMSSSDGVIVTMDADESHAPAHIAAMLEAAQAGFDVAIASRFQPGSQVRGVPLHRRALSQGASLLFRALFPIPGVRDFTSGYRAYRASVLRRALDKFGDQLFEFDDFLCTVDLLLKLRSVGARFIEVEMDLRYDLKKGPSKMRALQTAKRTLKLAIRRRLVP